MGRTGEPTMKVRRALSQSSLNRRIRTRRKTLIGVIHAIALILTAQFTVTAVAATYVTTTASELAAMPRRRRRKLQTKGLMKLTTTESKPSWLATTADQKLRHLLAIDFTSAEIALATGSSIRTIEDRRRKLRNDDAKESDRSTKLNEGIDLLFSIVRELERLEIQATNIRAWLIGRSMYLEEQRPAILLSAKEFELVREAARAYATGETPQEFLTDRDPLPRPTEPAGV